MGICGIISQFDVSSFSPVLEEREEDGKTTSEEEKKGSLGLNLVFDWF